MSAGLIAAIGTGLVIALTLLKYFISGDAKRDADNEQAAKEEKSRQDAQTTQMESNQAHAAQESAGLGHMWDSVDAAMTTPDQTPSGKPGA